MYRYFKSLALVVLALALLSTSFVPLDAATKRARLDVWRPGVYQGEVTALAISPCSEQTVFVATYGAGVFWSQDAGENWSSMNKGLGNLYVMALFVSPNYGKDGTLFAGTRDGVFRWARDHWIPTDLTETVNTLVVSLPYGHYVGATVLEEDVFVGTDSGVSRGVFNYKTEAITWTLILSSTPVCALGLSPDYIVDSTVLVGSTRGLYVSEDRGDTWTHYLSNTCVCALAVSPNYAADKMAFVGTYDVAMPSSYSRVSLRQAINSPMASGLPQGRGRVIVWNGSGVGAVATITVCEVAGPVKALAVLSEAISCQHQQAIFVGTKDGIVKFCRCSGPTLCHCGDPPPMVSAHDTNVIVAGPGCMLDCWPGCVAERMIFAGGPAGVVKSADEGIAWANCGEIPKPTVNAITFSPNYAQDHTVYAATSEDGVQISRDGGGSWTSYGLLDYDVRTLIAVSCPAGGCILVAGTWAGGIFTTTCGVDNPSWVPSGHLGCVNALAAATDGHGGSVVFAGTCREGIYKATLTAATNCQLNWQPSNGGLDSSNITALYTSPAYITDTTVFAGAAPRGIYKSTDGGASWRKVSDARDVLVLAISPHYSQYQIIGFGHDKDQTVLAGTTNGIYKSTDGGDSWALVGPSCPVYALSFSPDYAKDQTVYAGTYGCGVVESCNGGDSWAPMNAGLGNLYVRSLAITPIRPWTLLAGTDGSGVWLYTVSYKIYLPIIMRSYPHGW